MSRLILILLLVAGTGVAVAQTCTLSASGTLNWNNGTCQACDEGGVTSCTATTIIVPSDLILRFDTNTDTWAGSSLIVYGEVRFVVNIVINASIEIKNGGQVTILDGGKLDIGSASDDPCPYTISVETGGNLDFTGGTSSDRLRICNKTIALPTGAGGCNPYPTGPTPYCEPTGGFTGPFTFTESGLPVTLLYFRAFIPQKENYALLEWATDKEESFSHFELQRAGSDLKFATIQEIPGAGYNTESVKRYSTMDENPLVGTGYYRLKAVDIDGSHEYFQVRSVNYNGGRKIMVSPNPALGTSFKYTINFDPGPYDRVTLVDPVGNELYSGTVTGIENDVVLSNAIRPGAYLLRYSSPSFTQVARIFIKE